MLLQTGFQGQSAVSWERKSSLLTTATLKEHFRKTQIGFSSMLCKKTARAIALISVFPHYEQSAIIAFVNLHGEAGPVPL